MISGARLEHKMAIKTMIILILYELWKERNECTFRSKVAAVTSINEAIRRTLDFWRQEGAAFLEHPFGNPPWDIAMASFFSPGGSIFSLPFISLISWSKPPFVFPLSLCYLSIQASHELGLKKKIIDVTLEDLAFKMSLRIEPVRLNAYNFILSRLICTSGIRTICCASFLFDVFFPFFGSYFQSFFY